MALIEQLPTRPAAWAGEAQSDRSPVSLPQVAALLRGLNREQRQAVSHRAGPLLVLAGPGTGKTEVITRRVAWLISSKRALPRQILALTFTAKAAAEMQARVDVLVPYGQAETAIHTFHAFGDRILREHAFELGLPGDVRLIGRAEAVVLLRENLPWLGLERYAPLAQPDRFLGALVDLLWRAKDEGLSAAQLEAHAAGLLSRAAAAAGEDAQALRDEAIGQAEIGRAYQRYCELLTERGLVDHSDQVLLPLRLLRERPAVRRALRQRYQYVLVDEFQDTNPAQLELVLELCGPAGNLTVVGDDDQAIYAFRGAAVSNIRRLTEAQPQLRQVVLRRNYRSTAPIIEAGQRLIAHNGERRLAALAESPSAPLAHRRAARPSPLRVLAHASRAEEADGVARIIAQRVEGGERPASFALLVRTNADADAFARSLAALGVPVRPSTPVPLHERAEIRPLLGFLRVVADPSSSADVYALACAAPYTLGGADLTAILSLARRRHRPLWDVLVELERQPGVLRLAPPTRRAIGRLLGDVNAALEQCHVRSAGEVLYDFLRRSGRLARLVEGGHEGDDPGALQDIVRFFELVRSQSALLGQDRVAQLVPYLDELLAAGAPQEEDAFPAADEVAVLTVHRAKGLEFPVVFIAGLTDGRFPLRARSAALSLPPELCRGTPDEDDALAEERRLFYVALTRARDEVWLSYALDAGTRAGKRPSPFIAEALDMLPAGLPTDARAPALVAPLPPAPSQRPPARALEQRGSLSLSFSQLEDYFGCPERYRLRHVVGVPTPAHHALVYGNALHQAVAAFHLSQASGEQLSEEALLGVFAAHWSPEGFLSRSHEEARYRAGQAALRRFRREQLDLASPAPAAVERPFTFALGSDRVTGRMDRLDRTPAGAVITDYKSSDVRDQRRADQRARESLQLQVYALAHRAESGALPAELRLHFLDSGVIGRAEPEESRLERARQRISRAAADIRAELFEPRPGAVTCGYCPYRAICPSSAA